MRAISNDSSSGAHLDLGLGTEAWWRRVVQPDGPSRIVTTHFAWRRIPEADTFVARLGDGTLLATIRAPQSPAHGWRWRVIVSPGPRAARGALVAADVAATVGGEAATYAAASAAIRAAEGPGG